MSSSAGGLPNLARGSVNEVAGGSGVWARWRADVASQATKKVLAKVAAQARSTENDDGSTKKVMTDSNNNDDDSTDTEWGGLLRATGAKRAKLAVTD